MPRDAHGNARVAPADPGWGGGRRVQQPGVRSRPAGECLGWKTRDVRGELLRLGGDQDQTFAGRTLLYFEQTQHCWAVSRVTTETEAGLGGVGDDSASAQGSGGQSKFTPIQRASIPAFLGKRLVLGEDLGGRLFAIGSEAFADLRVRQS